VKWSRQKWVTKFATGEFSNGKNMQRWWFCMASNCPQCNQEVEDKLHMPSTYGATMKEPDTEGLGRVVTFS